MCNAPWVWSCGAGGIIENRVRGRRRMSHFCGAGGISEDREKEQEDGSFLWSWRNL